MDFLRFILPPILVLLAAVMIGAGIIILVKSLNRIRKPRSR